MKVILQTKVRLLGELGDIVSVKRGYARNYLLPFDKAVRATNVNIQYLQRRKSELLEIEAKLLEEAKLKAEKITGMTFEIFVKTGEEEKLFGSPNAFATFNQALCELESRAIRPPSSWQGAQFANSSSAPWE